MALYTILAALGGAVLLVSIATTPVAPAAVTGAPLAQATATPTATPTPLAAAGWERTDHPDSVRCYWNTLGGAPFGGCVVVP